MNGPLRNLFGVLAAIVIAPVFAQTAPPQLPFSDVSWKALSKAKPATHLKMGDLEVRFEETTLRAVSGTAGVGSMHHQGDAGESIYWLCYTVQGDAKAQRIWIVAHGEMGGLEHAVTMVTAQELPPTVQPTIDCPALPSTLQPLSLVPDVWLGIPESKASKVLGRPSYRKGPWRSFDYQGKVPGNCLPDGFDLMNWLVFRTVQGRIVEISAGQVTSC
jgi:hypothetical protein